MTAPSTTMPASPPSIPWLNKDSRTFLERGYLLPGVTPEACIRQIAEYAESILEYPGFADQFEGYMHKGWYSLSTPIWTNFGAGRGLPISCFGCVPDDTMESILTKVAEVGMQSKHGGGTSAYFGHLRPRGAVIGTGGKSSGPVHFMELFDKVSAVVSQSNVRRGSFAAYLPVEHPDIHEFLTIRNKEHVIQDMSLGVTITDAWMESMLAGDKPKRKLWGEIVKKRGETGFPYIYWYDTINNAAPQVYRDKGMKIVAGNLCAEIMLASTPTESFVCDLSSLNLIHYDEWKDTNAPELLTYFLDAVMSDFIRLTETIPYMDSARRFAINQRALGVGVLGWHSYLQSKMIPFESLDAKLLNTQIFRLIQQKTLAASKEMAARYGEPELMKGYGQRNVTTMTIAPTTSSSFILGQASPAIEPEKSVYYVRDLAKGEYSYRNPYLKALLKAKGLDTRETWADILTHGGSVQHLSFLDQREKDVFKTFGEISPKEIIIQAAARQQYIDQGQSLNLLIPPSTPPKQISDLMIEAWRLGVKGLYYVRSSNPVQSLVRDILTCSSCQ